MKIIDDIKVFPVSSTEYFNSFNKHRFALFGEDIEASNIPRLRRYLKSLPLKSNIKELKKND